MSQPKKGTRVHTLAAFIIWWANLQVAIKSHGAVSSDSSLIANTPIAKTTHENRWRSGFQVFRIRNQDKVTDKRTNNTKGYRDLSKILQSKLKNVFLKII